MIITFDVGNTSVAVCGIYEGEILFRNKCSTGLYQEQAGYLPALTEIKEKNHIETKDISGTIIASVVPDADIKLKEVVTAVFGVEPYVASTQSKTGIGIKIKNNREVGMDRLVDCAAAAHYYGCPVMVYDLGSASTMSVVDKNGNFIGGTISAGVQLSLDTLGERCAKLPKISALEVKIEKTIGDDTVSNLANGALLGTASMIDGMIPRVEKELGCEEGEMKVVLTGGNGPLVYPHLLNKSVILDPELLAKGLVLIYKLNCENNK